VSVTVFIVVMNLLMIIVPKLVKQSISVVSGIRNVVTYCDILVVFICYCKLIVSACISLLNKLTFFIFFLEQA